MKAIVWAGLICGVLDGFCAIAITLFFSGKVMRTFQGIAAGVLGAKAFHGGPSAALLGLALHFLIAFGAAAVYYLASRHLLVLIRHALATGILYGIVVHLFMQFVVIPLSAIGPRPLVWRNFIAVLIAHILVVGPSIAIAIRSYSR